MKRIKFYTELHTWILIPTIRVSLVGNNHRLWSIGIKFLCFELIFCIDEDSYKDIRNHTGVSE